MDLLTQILKGLEHDLNNSIYYLKPVAIQILAWFLAFELVSSMVHSEAGTNPLTILKDKIKVWAYLYAVIYYFDDLLDLINSMFSYFSSVAIGGEEVPKLTSIPFNVLKLAFDSLGQLADYIKLTQPSTWLLIVGMALGLFVFAKISLTVGMVVIEYMVMSSLVIILVPFMMFKKLSFVGDKVIGMLINLNMKLLMIRFLMFYFAKFLSEPLDLNNVQGLRVIEQTFYWLVAMGILGLMAMQGHTLAQALISGATSFGDSSELVGKAREGISSTIGRGWNTLKGTIGKAHGFGQGVNQGMKASTESGAGGIVGSVQGTLQGMREGKNERSNHVGSYGIGGAVGGWYQGRRNVRSRKSNPQETEGNSGGTNE